MRKVTVIASIFLRWLQTVTGSWSPDLPLSDLTNMPADNYSVYVSNLFHAANERARVTAIGLDTEVEWQLVGSSFQRVTNTVIDYDVSPIDPRVEQRPWPAGVTNVITTFDGIDFFTETQIVEVVRYDYAYTNGTWITNNIIAEIDIPWNDTVITSVVHRESAYVGGEMVTNVAYNASVTNQIIYNKWVETGKAYELLKDGMYTNQFGDHWPDWTTPPPTVWNFFEVYFTKGSAYYTNSEYGTGYIPASTNIELELSYRLYNTNTHAFESVPVTVIYTNYFFQPTNNVLLSSTVFYYGDINFDSFTYNASDIITITNSYRVMTNDFSSVPNPELVYDIRELIETLVPEFLDTSVVTNADVTAWGQKTYYMWTYDFSNPPDYESWQLKTNGVLAIKYPAGLFEDPVYTMPDPPNWTLTGIYEHTGAGTNLYRVRPKVDITNPAYTNATGFPYIENNGPFTYDTGLDGWQVGDLTNEFIIYTNQSLVYITNNNPQPLLVAPHDIDIDLGTYEWKVQLEQEDIAGGFSSTYWYYDATGELVLSTNETWLSDINYDNSGNAFTPVTNVYSTYTDGDNTYIQEYRYFENGAGAYLVPLLKPDTLSDKFQDYYFVTYVNTGDDFNPVITMHATLRALTWVLVDDLATGLAMVTGWSTMYTNDLQSARTMIHRAGFPTQVNEYNIGHPSTGPSGYYYPGGYIRPRTYAVGLEYTDAWRVAASTQDRGIDDRTYRLPYLLDNMTWDTLVNWTNTSIAVTASPSAGMLPAVDATIAGYRLYTEGPGALRGYNWGTLGTTTEISTNVAALPAVTGITEYTEALLSIEAATTRSARTFRYDTSRSRGVSAVDPTAVTTATVWNVAMAWDVWDNGLAVTDSYFYASTKIVTNTPSNITNTFDVVTNDSVVVTNTITNVITTLIPELIPTNYVVNVESPNSTITAKYRFYIDLNNISLYNGYVAGEPRSTVFAEGQILTPDFVDSMYAVLNELLYTTGGYDWYDVYDGIYFDRPSWGFSLLGRYYPDSNIEGIDNIYNLRTQGSTAEYLVDYSSTTEYTSGDPTFTINVNRTYSLASQFGATTRVTQQRNFSDGMVGLWTAGSYFNPEIRPEPRNDIDDVFAPTVRRTTTGVPVEVGRFYHTGNNYYDFNEWNDRLITLFNPNPFEGPPAYYNLGGFTPLEATVFKREKVGDDWEISNGAWEADTSGTFIRPEFPFIGANAVPFPGSLLELDAYGNTHPFASFTGQWPTEQKLSRVVDPTLTATVNVYGYYRFDAGEYDIDTATGVNYNAYSGGWSIGFTGYTNFYGTNTSFKPLHGTIPIGSKDLVHSFSLPGGVTTYTNVHNFVGQDLALAWQTLYDISDTVSDTYISGTNFTTTLNHTYQWKTELSLPYAYSLWYPTIVNEWDFEYQE